MYVTFGNRGFGFESSSKPVQWSPFFSMFILVQMPRHLVGRSPPSPTNSLFSYYLEGKDSFSSLKSHCFPFSLFFYFSLLFIQPVFLNFKENKGTSQWVQGLPEINIQPDSYYSQVLLPAISKLHSSPVSAVIHFLISLFCFEIILVNLVLFLNTTYNKVTQPNDKSLDALLLIPGFCYLFTV